MSQVQAQQTLQGFLESNRESLLLKGMSESVKEYRLAYRATIGYKRRTQGAKILGKGVEKADNFGLFFSEYMEGGELKVEVPKEIRSKYANWEKFMYKDQTRGSKKISPSHETDKECYDRLIDLGYFKAFNTVKKCKARAKEEKKKPKRKAGRKPLSDEEKAERLKKKADDKKKKADDRALKKEKSDKLKVLNKQKAKEERDAKKAEKALKKEEEKAKKPKKAKKSKAKPTKKKKKVSKAAEPDVNGTLDKEEYELEKQKDEADQKLIEQAQVDEDDEKLFPSDDSDSEAEDLSEAELKELEQRLKNKDETVSSDDDEEVQEESADESAEESADESADE